MLFADVLYPKEVLGVMGSVLNGSWDGPNPEQVIDQLIYDFVMKIADKRGYQNRVITAVKELGCLDCVLARLNLECLLEPDEGDRIVIRRNRVGRLPGEFVPFDQQPAQLAAAAKKEALKLASGHTVEFEDEREVELPPPETPVPPVLQDLVKAPPVGGPAEFRAAELGPDGEPVFEYPDDQKTLDEIERTFYAEETVYKQFAPAPQLSPERKIEVMEHLKGMNYKLEETREKAFSRLEKLLKKRSLEQSLIGRLAYLIIFQAFKQMSPGQCLMGISPRGMLPAGFGT